MEEILEKKQEKDDGINIPEELQNVFDKE